MNICKIIASVMVDTKTTQKSLLLKINALAGKQVIKSQSVVSERLKNKNIGVDKAFEMLDAMGYEIIIQPKSTRGKRATGSYVITKEDEQEEE